jgi:hypothetical protein
MWEARDVMQREIGGRPREWPGPEEGVWVNYGLYTGKEGDEMN